MSTDKENDLFETETNWFHVFKMMFDGNEETEVSKMGPYAFTLWCAIKAHINWQDGRAFPSLDTLSKKTGISNRKIRESLKELETMGYLTIKPRTKGKGNLYYLREKFKIVTKEGDEAALVSMDYVPDLIKSSMTELKNVIATGDFAGTKLIHINQLNIQVIGKAMGGSQINSGFNFDLSALDLEDRAKFMEMWSKIQRLDQKLQANAVSPQA